jgi:dihydropteroate synthase
MTTEWHPARLRCGNRVLDLTHPQVMGILNVTPDSFSDGGRYHLRDSALRHAVAMVAAGASMIDVGGESTRPGAQAITAELDVIVSVDTSTPLVMLEAARLGAGLINDVRALRRDGALLAAAATGLPVCLMHMQGEPGDMQRSPHYVDLLSEVSAFFAQRLVACASVGIQAEQVLLDPGFGFAKNLEHNLSLFKHLQALQVFGRPLLVGVSRKSMIGQALGRDVDRRLAGGLALAALAIAKGAKILRVHDVSETVDVIRMIAAVEAAD